MINKQVIANEVDVESRVTHSDGRLLLTKLWEYIQRTKSLPVDVDIHNVYISIRDRLRDPEKEVRQHALCVLCSIIPITNLSVLDVFMQIILPELFHNLDHIAPSLRKAVVDSLQVYLQYTTNYDKILKKFINSNVNLSTIICVIPYLITNTIRNQLLHEIADILFANANSANINQEQALKSLARINYLVGSNKFNKVIGEKLTEYKKMCDTLGLPTELDDLDFENSNKTMWNNDELVEDRVILETEITLDSGPAITMQIHEESRPNSVLAASESEEDSRHDVGVVRVLADDSESDYYEQARRTPRKVRFGGEVVKMRTPESDSSNPESDSGTTIHITVTDAVSIKTKKSLIPVRVTSLPSTPRKSLTVPRRLHKSTPNLYIRSNSVGSKIPLRYKSVTKTNISIKEKSTKIDNSKQEKEEEKEKTPAKKPTDNTLKVKPKVSQARRNSRQEDVYSPIPVHNEIELFHNLTRSPERSRKPSISDLDPISIEQKNLLQKENETAFKESLSKELEILDKSARPVINAENKNFVEKQNNWKAKEIDTANNNWANNNSNKWSVKELAYKPPESNWFPKDKNDNWTAKQEKTTKESSAKETTSKENYNSFQLCPENGTTDGPDKLSRSGDNSFDKADVDNRNLHQHLQIAHLQGEEEIWAKTEALDNLIFALKQPNTCSNLESGPASLLFEALFACQHRDRLHGKADEALEIMIRGVQETVLDHCMGRLAPNFCKMAAPVGVRLSMMVMRKCSARKFQVEVIERGYGHRTREGALQILMASARLLPSSDVEVLKSAQFATIALRDRRRRVRHAALELLATLAQLKSNSDILDIVDNNIAGCPDQQHLMRIVRTRLSRRQLPTIEADGSVRYSTPRDPTEIEWLSGTTLAMSSESSSSSVLSVNYWRHNLRHADGPVTDLVLETKTDNDDNGNGVQTGTQIWAVDSAAFSKTGKNVKTVAPGILRPVYILQPEETNLENGVRGHRRYDRGRSFSPPKPQRKVFNGSQEGLSGSAPQSGIGTHTSLKYPDSFRKSFSSEQLYCSDRTTQEPYSLSLSSRSSTTSTGSSTRSGIWQRDFRSGIPVPITSDTKLKIRTSTNHSNGPLIARRTIFGSPQESPAVCRAPSQVVGGTPQLVPPKSSGSESSGYYTPPSETHQAFVKLDTLEQIEMVGNTDEKDCVDGESPISQHRFVKEESLQRELSMSSPETSEANEYDRGPHVLGEQIENKLKEELTLVPYNPPAIQQEIVHLEDVPTFTEQRNKSKSVVDLQTFLPEINTTGRKSVGSAPAINPDVGAISVVDFDETPISPLKTSIPGSLEEEVAPAAEPGPSKGNTSCRLSKRFARTQSRRSVRSTPRTPAVESSIQNHLRPFSKPKEALNQALLQMESNEWEITVQGLNSLSRILRFHPDQVENNMHTVCMILAKHVKNLRSQVSRVACGVSAEMFSNCKRGLDMEIEEMACPLLQRTADTNKFLRADANAALDVMAEFLPLPRVVAVLTSRGCLHQNAVVRAASTRILNDLVARLGPDRTMILPKETRDKILLAAANSLGDGSLEARRHAKSIFSILILHPNFQRSLYEAVPQHTLRHITKALNSIKPNT